MEQNKILVLLLGAGSSGKTTTRQSICGVPEETILIKRENDKIHGTLYKDYAVAGNHNSGSDANTGPGLIIESTFECFKYRDIVFFDGVMGTPRLLEIPEKLSCSVLLVHFNLSHAEVYRRLLNRRRIKGKVEDTLPEKTLHNSISFIKRAENTMKHFETKCITKMHKIEILDGDSTVDAVEKIKQGLTQC